jgi:hypothetical protein
MGKDALPSHEKSTEGETEKLSNFAILQQVDIATIINGQGENIPITSLRSAPIIVYYHNPVSPSLQLTIAIEPNRST